MTKAGSSKQKRRKIWQLATSSSSGRKKRIAFFPLLLRDGKAFPILSLLSREGWWCYGLDGLDDDDKVNLGRDSVTVPICTTGYFTSSFRTRAIVLSQ
jgi:hypothetical protein